jgi:hypothetical protein
MYRANKEVRAPSNTELRKAIRQLIGGSVRHCDASRTVRLWYARN